MESRVLFMGTPDFAVPSLRALAERFDVVAVATRLDKPRGRGRRVAAPPVKDLAVELGIPVEQFRTLRETASQERIRSYEPDMIVVAAYGMILPPEVLDIPPAGCLNVHASLLPKHRGASPVTGALLGGDTETGVTIMLMDEGLDTGPILLQRAVPVAPRATAPELSRELSDLGAELLIEAIVGVAGGSVRPQAQDPEQATMTRLLTKADGEIDWGLPAERIDRMVRALQPWPCAWTGLSGESLRIWSCADPGVTRKSGTAGAKPGTVIGAEPGGIEVACGDDWVLVLTEVQRAGGKRLRAGDFLRGRPVEIGTVLQAFDED